MHICVRSCENGDTSITLRFPIGYYPFRNALFAFLVVQDLVHEHVAFGVTEHFGLGVNIVISQSIWYQLPTLFPLQLFKLCFEPVLFTFIGVLATSETQNSSCQAKSGTQPRALAGFCLANVLRIRDCWGGQKSDDRERAGPSLQHPLPPSPPLSSPPPPPPHTHTHSPPNPAVPTRALSSTTTLIPSISVGANTSPLHSPSHLFPLHHFQDTTFSYGTGLTQTILKEMSMCFNLWLRCTCERYIGLAFNLKTNFPRNYSRQMRELKR